MPGPLMVFHRLYRIQNPRNERGSLKISGFRRCALNNDATRAKGKHGGIFFRKID
jgi:hypothetical protein